MSDNDSIPQGAAGDGHRAPDGRFLPGNKAGKGNPLARRAQRLRAELFRQCTPARFQAIIGALLDKAEAGDIVAIKETLERVLGAPVAIDVLERLEALEARLETKETR